MKAWIVLLLIMCGPVAAACGATSDREEVATPPASPPVFTPSATATASPATANLPTATAVVPPPTKAASLAPFDELKFLASMPLPNDAEIVPVTEGIDIGYRTRQSEPAIITLYTNWIGPQGWIKATELPYLQPNERWTNGGFEFVVYITPKGSEGVAVINIQVRLQTAP